MQPHPVEQPNLTGKFPLTDMRTGLTAALVTLPRIFLRRCAPSRLVESHHRF